MPPSAPKYRQLTRPGGRPRSFRSLLPAPQLPELASSANAARGLNQTSSSNPLKFLLSNPGLLRTAYLHDHSPMRPVSRYFTRSAAGPVIGILNIRRRRPAISDEPRPSPEGEEVQRPVQHYEEAVSESYEKIDVCEAPQQPSRTATELDASKLRYCAAPSDDSQHPEVPV